MSQTRSRKTPPKTTKAEGAEKKAGGTVLDLDEARKARREQRGEVVLRFMGEDIPLPPGLPAAVMELVDDLDHSKWDTVMAALGAMIGETQLARVQELATAGDDPLEIEDVMYLLENVMTVYGVSLPES